MRRLVNLSALLFLSTSLAYAGEGNDPVNKNESVRDQSTMDTNFEKADGQVRIPFQSENPTSANANFQNNMN